MAFLILDVANDTQEDLRVAVGKIRIEKGRCLVRPPPTRF